MEETTISKGFVQRKYNSNFDPGSEFLDFQFGDFIGSSNGLVRVSDGDRYELALTPELQDFVIDIPNGIGQYYYGTNYQTKKINISFAFDNLSEQNLAKIKKEFNTNTIKKLYLSENPDRFYYAKLTDTCQIKHLCFEKNGERIYKGEGSLTFTCYYPFSQSETYYLTKQNLISMSELTSKIGSYAAISDTDILSNFNTVTKVEDDENNLPQINANITLDDLLIFCEEASNTIVYFINSGDLPMPLTMTFSNFTAKEGEPVVYNNGTLAVYDLATEDQVNLEITATKNVVSVLKELYSASLDSEEDPIANITFEKGKYSYLQFDNREQWVIGFKNDTISTLANDTMIEGSFFEILPHRAYALDIQNMTLDSMEFCYIYK